MKNGEIARRGSEVMGVADLGSVLTARSAGRHDPNFGGTYAEFGFTLDITYHVTVV